jgi:DNA-binding NarL/FixJ family response regulator
VEEWTVPKRETASAWKATVEMRPTGTERRIGEALGRRAEASAKQRISMYHTASSPRTRKSNLLNAVNLSAAAWSKIAHRFDLSARELAVAQGIFAGLAETEIAQQCGISLHTVHTYSRRLYCKLAVASRVELVLCVTTLLVL